MNATEFAASAVVGVLSGGLGAWIGASGARRLARGTNVRTDVDDLFAGLGALRSGYRRCARLDPEAPGENRLADLEDALTMAAARLPEPVIAAVDSYLDVGRLYAARDEDTGASAEETAFREVVVALVAERKAYQP